MRVTVIPVAHYNQPYMDHVMSIFYKEGHDVRGFIGTKPLKKRIQSQESDFILVVGLDDEVNTTVTVYDKQTLIGTMPIQEAMKMISARGIRYTLKNN